MQNVTLIVCGGRSFSNWPHLNAVLDSIHRRRRIVRIIHGGANGADTFAGRWAKSRGIEEVACEARWDTHGRSAGPMRNAYMLSWQPDGVVAFPGGRGTADMVKQARENGVPVKEVR